MSSQTPTTDAASAAPLAPGALSFESDEARLESFRRHLDELHERVKADVGQKDLDYVRRLHRFSRAAGWTGRALIALSPGPLSFGLGVLSLFVHKQLQATEIGHTVLHGAYDKIEGDHPFQSKTWWWDTPIDEEAWRLEHNVKHHQYTNVVGRDPDVRYGFTRLNEHVPYADEHKHQLAGGILTWFGFGFWMNAHATGLTDVYIRKPGDYDVIDAQDPAQVKEAHRKAFRKWIPYYAREFVLFPLLSGPFFLKTILGNALTEVMRDVYSSATIWCGHVGEATSSFPEGTKAGGRAKWYAMQVEASNNFEVPLPISMLCGGLDRQIEHHLFPRLAPPRLREIAPEVRQICEAHGVEYRSESWGRTLVKALKQVFRLQNPAVDASRAVQADAAGAPGGPETSVEAAAA